MAVNPVQFLVASNASITDGSKIVNISGNVDCSRVYSGTAVFLGGADNPAEAVSGTSPDGSGNSTITLRNNWSQGDVVNQQMVTFNTNEGLAEAISNVREIVSNVSAIEDLATQGLIKRIDDNTYEVVNISSQGESLITANDASSQRSVMGLGSAATKDVTTSTTDSNETRLMKVSDFGLGETVATGYPRDNFDDATVPCGFYRLINGNPSTGTRPEGFSYFGFILVQSYAINSKLQVYTDIDGKRAFRVISTDNIRPWQELYHSGNSVNAKSYGLGLGMSIDVDDWDNPRESGFYRGSTSTTPNAPLSGALNFAGLRIASFNANNGGLLTFNNASNRWFVNTHSGGTLTGWQELYHSGNTNFNEVLGDGTTGLVLWGQAYNSSEIRFFIPIFKNLVATGITVEGTFSLSYYQNPVLSGIGGGSGGIEFLSSSRNVAVLRITGLSNLDLSRQYNLFAEQNSAKITLNF